MYFDTEQFLENLFELYFQCRKNKRYSFGALTFEVDFENNLMQLYRELQTKTWHPGSCNCFIVDKPVKREIFAAPFKDRIVHHILISELEPCFEKYFIHDSYACRKGKGTHMAIKRLFHFINSQTCNNSQEAWILKMDIKGFFMNIERKKLYEKLAQNHKPSKEELNEIQASINSYLGIMRHYKSWRFRVKVLKEYFKEKLSKHFRIEKSAIKIEKKK